MASFMVDNALVGTVKTSDVETVALMLAQDLNIEHTSNNVQDAICR